LRGKPKVEARDSAANTPMSKLEAASARLNAALERLERAVSATSGAKATELLKEREVLLGRLAELEENARSLASANEQIETRLDGAIGEIRAALGR
jgi:predicted phage-related endonuclease